MTRKDKFAKKIIITNINNTFLYTAADFYSFSLAVALFLTALLAKNKNKRP